MREGGAGLATVHGLPALHGGAAEARRMHYGEIEERAIRGQATPQETAELLDEGIVVLPLLIPEAAKETLQ